ncbi:radical SAM family heme chaperone HemW [Sediminicurvatus halobius]|uniref:Heme chaperone HemW n=1 Tax=Sediminicurvatus halobius TaxID=2182432 RepID=A0A2U2N6J8_9GAMM|nr:radical SAM family heme chaperone HemW [Spiribacter halobius]PWG64805.1 oxygen-independent coproporphyrinogen III oxidase-like protein [Spiribacter halobius]UEX78341.1 radical SAM family heme chaperone HemW [Spiribacter halobius]
MTPLPPLGLYLHLPWCVQKCPYCDFNSHALRGPLPETDYLTALLRDAAWEAPTATGRSVRTIFIGGGTPSLFSPAAIGQLLEGLSQHLTVAGDAEITLEANPGTVEQKRFEGFRAAGVNRLSIGVQSFDAGQLHRLGRIHGPGEARAAARAARAAGFERFNLDLMFALPDQDLAGAVADVDAAIALEPEHISHYQLTLEPGTAFHARPPALPDEDLAADMEAACAERLAAAGFVRYEVSAWSRPGGACRHNLNYWRFGDYLALGAGGHGKLSTSDGRIQRTRKVALPRHYQTVAGTPAAVAEAWEVPADERVLEYLMNALRLVDGAPRAEALARTGLPWSAFAPGVAEARARGWMVSDPERLAATAEGLRFLNDLLGLFLEPATEAAS